jgi:SAM-dependent methyltransferase
MACCCSPLTASVAGHFNDRRARGELAALQKNGPGPTTRRLLEGLHAVGADSGTVIDVGSGIGALALGLLAAGFREATCVDMSPAAIAIGREEAERRGYLDRIRWVEADFVATASELGPADLVTLDRVVCCYPAYGPLLEQAAAHGGRFLALSYPRDRWFVRVLLLLENLLRRLQGDPFRAFVHPVGAMNDLLERQGFRRIYRESTLGWWADVYARERA